MIEQLNITALLAFVDDCRVVAELTQYPSRESRLKELQRCIWLRDGERISIWQPGFVGEYKAVLLDVEEEPVAYVEGVFDHMFGPIEARRLAFATRERLERDPHRAEAGEPFRARYVGPYHGRLGHAWTLDRDDWLGRPR